MKGLFGPIPKEVIEHFADKERQEIRKLKARIEIAEVELEELKDELEEVQGSLASREKQLEVA